MTDKDKIIKELKEALDNLDVTNKYRLNLIRAIEYLQKEPASEGLEEAMQHNSPDNIGIDDLLYWRNGFITGANWKENHLWKPTDGDDLPEIDREVIAILDNGKVVYAHRPPEYWDGKNIITGKVTRNYPKTYDKGGWNIPDIKWWLDVELPKEIEHDKGSIL